MPAASFERCFALFVLTQCESEDDFKAVSHDLWRRNDAVTRAARSSRSHCIARHYAARKRTIAQRLDAPIKERAFNPKTPELGHARGSDPRARVRHHRAKALHAAEKTGIRDRMLALMDSSASLSTQENPLAAARIQIDHRRGKGGSVNSTTEPQGVVSKTVAPIAWLDRKIDKQL
jgi:hypothetical protein